MKRLIRLLVLVLALVGLGALAAGASLLRDGIGTRAEPGRFETASARRLRSLGIPREARALANPIAADAAAVEDGLAHFADHCATCHGNDGRGDTPIGRNLYPKSPDMRQPATQSLTDGELFYIIENGVKLTGMPAWSDGTAEGVASSWRLVHFIRHLPKLTKDEIVRMESLNPRTPEEWREQERERKSLEGDRSAPAPKPAPHKHGGHK